MHELQKYRFSQSIDHSFNVAELFNEDYLKTFIKTLTDLIGAPNEKAASSIFIKRYAFLAVISLYAMTALNKKVNVSLENVIMESAVQGIEWLPKFSFNDLTLEDWNGEHRNDWRISFLQDLFAKKYFTVNQPIRKNFQNLQINFVGKYCSLHILAV
jgi:ferric iron reductase protein FhuF